MNEKLALLSEKFNQLETRMRLLVSFAIALVLGLILDLIWLSPNSRKIDQINSEFENTQKQINDTLKTQAALNQSIVDQRNHPKRKELERLVKQTNEVKSLLKEKTTNLVIPREMTKVLNEIIKSTGQMKLIQLKKHEPYPLFKESEENQEIEQIQLYRHAIELTLEGNYSRTQKFIEALETMPQKVAFDRFQFTVEEYPKSQVRLIVSTLSFSKKWIGG